MRSSPGKIVVGAIVTALAVAGVLVWRARERPYDPDFDPRVAEPAYSTHRPIALYDEGHLETHTSDAAYKPFADLARNDGYDLRTTRELLSERTLAGVSVLVLVCARGSNDANDAPAFADSEISAIDRWVRAGGSLLLVTDHWPYGVAAQPLARSFGVQMGGGLVEDREHSDAILGESTLLFTEESGLRDHPIVRGRKPSERVRRVMTFTGQSLLGPPEAVPFLALSDSAIERPPGPAEVKKDGGDVRVEMEYGEPVSAKGRAQGVALEVEQGRIVVLGEAGMLRAQRERTGALTGMNHPGCDNRQLALNILHWLSRAI